MPGSLLLLLLGLASPHPLHSSSATLTDGGGRITLTVRIFSDDLAAAAPGGDSAIAAYVRRQVRLSGPDGAPVMLRFERIVPDGELTQVTAQVLAPGGLAGVRVQYAVLWERYRDQVNLLRVMVAGRTSTQVFSHGDPPRAVT